ncbi:mechanosensitive ion channel protein MscS [Moraxella macacae 0408225]|uniref:Mechanosensitive ion channel protein MscS n=1 Tax=Moraxella macacae 0408225 TaxID=1230338 RepID=L2F696_9GAMM|nr:mechanosensitive ion channel family protein [Moraxella macacae]ELA08547.1 mechanosensitive ion channel protein MscS [Moraxella macacae 0408225]
MGYMFGQCKKVGANLLLSAGLTVSLTTPVLAAVVKPPTATASAPAPTAVQDTFGRDTPRGAIQGLLKALARDDTKLAGHYLATNQRGDTKELIADIKTALDTGGRIANELQISNEVQGDLDDKLAPNLDKVGSVTLRNNHQDKTIDILFERVKQKDGRQVWLMSEQTLKAIQAVESFGKTTIVEKYMPRDLLNKEIKGYSIGHILAVIAVLVATYALSLLLSWILYAIFRGVYLATHRNDQTDDKKVSVPIDKRVIVPMAMILTGIFIQELMLIAGINLVVRNIVERMAEILSWVASVWLFLRILDIIFTPLERYASERNHSERLSVLNLLRKVIKALLLIVAAIVILGNLGFDLTTGIAALGIGGLALALGAQKTIENLVGSVSLVADQPVNVGDYCVFGNQEGTVEDIGIRSTRLRTLNRTLVTIPNGSFSSMSIENYTKRDMFHFNQQFYVSRDSDTKKLREFIEEVQIYIVNHPLTNSTWNQVWISGTQQDAYIVDVRCYLNVKGVMDFYDKQTLIIMRIAEIMQEMGITNALPTSHIKMENAKQNLIKDPVKHNLDKSNTVKPNPVKHAKPAD